MVSNSRAQEHREAIEWCNIRWENTNDTTLPRVLLIGDSITLGYSGCVKERLKGKANVDVLATSKAISDPALQKEIAYALEGYRHAVVHFNNGLHGWHVTELQYEESLKNCIKMIRRLSPDAAVVWASTTPVPSARDGVALDEERNAVVLARNKRAEKVMQESGIPVNDLYALVVGDIEHLSAKKGDVHYNEKGKALQGEAVANSILKLLR